MKRAEETAKKFAQTWSAKRLQRTLTLLTQFRTPTAQEAAAMSRIIGPFNRHICLVHEGLSKYYRIRSRADRGGGGQVGIIGACFGGSRSASVAYRMSDERLRSYREASERVSACLEYAMLSILRIDPRSFPGSSSTATSRNVPPKSCVSLDATHMSHFVSPGEFPWEHNSFLALFGARMSTHDESKIPFSVQLSLFDREAPWSNISATWNRSWFLSFSSKMMNDQVMLDSPVVITNRERRTGFPTSGLFTRVRCETFRASL